MKKVLCLMVIGEKYKQLYEKMRPQFEWYAKKCDADLELIELPPDPGFKRPLLSQKLLIPSLFPGYDLGLFLDLDIIISPDAPSVFDNFPAHCSFGAVIDPRGTPEFIQTWKHIERIPKETTTDYFVTRNFAENENLLGSINGGVFVFRPSETGELFRDYYFSDHNQGELHSYEETPMAYLTQVNKKFFPLDPRFNKQVLYELKGTAEGLDVCRVEQQFPSWIRNRYYKRSGNIFYPVKKYKRFISQKLEKAWFLHFAGGYPFKNLL